MRKYNNFLCLFLSNKKFNGFVAVIVNQKKNRQTVSEVYEAFAARCKTSQRDNGMKLVVKLLLGAHCKTTILWMRNEICWKTFHFLVQCGWMINILYSLLENCTSCTFEYKIEWKNIPCATWKQLMHWRLHLYPQRFRELSALIKIRFRTTATIYCRI